MSNFPKTIKAIADYKVLSELYPDKILTTDTIAIAIFEDLKQLGELDQFSSLELKILLQKIITLTK